MAAGAVEVPRAIALRLDTKVTHFYHRKLFNMPYNHPASFVWFLNI